MLTADCERLHHSGGTGEATGIGDGYECLKQVGVQCGGPYSNQSVLLIYTINTIR